MLEESTTQPAPDDAGDEALRYTTEIKLYEKEAQKWVDKTKKIVRRYKDERTIKDGGSAKFNILWSNIQTLIPALYAKAPKPDIERRYKDDDDLGRVASTVLERCASYFMDEYPFNAVMRQAVLDRLLSGRGVIWVRYEPQFKDVALEPDGSQVTDDVETSYQEVKSENVCFDYVHWEDFGHNVARTWEEVYLVYRKVFLDSKQLHKRFDKTIGAEEVDKIPLDYTPKNLKEEKVHEFFKKSTIYELWDIREKKAIWVHKDYPKVLDAVEDPLKLKRFFPCPQPIYATLANDSLIPVPDFIEYQDQAEELDTLTSRIHALLKAIKVAGVYAADAEGLENILSEGVENKLVPVEQWAMFAERGGMRGVFELLPVKDIATTALTLYDARERVKQDLYEITGIADIIRGATNASETATAQQIKGQFATMRLDAMQEDVARFARDLVAIMVEIVANHFQIDTIKDICGIRLMTAQEKQATQMQMQMIAQQGQQQPIPDEMQEALENPTWEEVEQLFKSDAALHFRINIETDSTIKADQEAEKASRIEFIQAVGGFMQQATQIQTPELVPLIGQLLLFTVRGFRVGKEVESAFEIAIRKLERQAENPPAPLPDPEMEKLKVEAQLKQEDFKLKSQIEQQKVQIEQEKANQEAAREAQRLAHEIEIENIRAKNQMRIEVMKAQNQMEIEKYKASVESEIQQNRAMEEREQSNGLLD